MNGKKPKVIVIGIDGGTWNIINKLIKNDKLSFFRKLIENGTHGRLETLIPPNTYLGWKGYSTGKNPGKFDVYGWRAIDLKKEKMSFVDSNSYKSLEIWDYLTKKNKSSIVINMPTTYPPKKIKGVMISYTMGAEKNYTYPREIESILKKIKYKVNTECTYLEDKDRTIQQCIDLIKKRFQATKFLLNYSIPDFLHLTIFYIDHIQHYYWKYMEKNDPKYGTAIYDIYELIDSELERFLCEFSTKDTYVVLISDHGFNGLKAKFNLGQWFVNKNYCKLRQSTLLSKILLKAGITIEKLTYFSKLFPFIRKHIPIETLNKFLPFIPDSKGNVNPFLNTSDKIIDFEKSKIILAEGKYINKKLFKNEKDCQKFIDKVILEMKNIKDPKYGNYLFSNVYRKGEIYWGEYLKNAPDIVADCSPGYFTASIFNLNKNNSQRSLWDYSLEGWSAHHDLYGIFCIFGPGVKKGYKRDSKICDLAPTILHIFGLPIPNDMDGRVLMEIFEEDSELAKRKPKYVDPSYYEKKDEEEKIKEEIGKLKKLGKI